MMENYSNSVYSDMFGLECSEGLKDSREVYNNNSYRDPVNNFMADEGIYSMDMGAAPLTFDSPSPLIGYHQDQAAPMLGAYDSVNQTHFGLTPEEQNLQLPPELADMVNSLLLEGSDTFPINDFDQASLDLSIAATDIKCDIDEDDLFTNNGAYGMLSPSYEDSGPLVNTQQDSPHLLQADPQQRQRKPRKAKTQANAVIAEEMNSMSSNLLPYEQYPSPAGDICGVPSPCSSSSGYSDHGSEEMGSKKTRQRRPRVSYSTLSEEEKYKRIRELNNEASRHYRERQRSVLSSLEQQLPALLEKNQHLKNKALALERLRDQMKHFSNSFLKQNMN